MLFYTLKRFLISVFTLSLVSCEIEKTNEESIPVAAFKTGAELYIERCVACHGSNGKLGFSGAKDLTQSGYTLDQIIHQVTYGKGAMAPYQNILSQKEIKEVGTYALSLQN